MATTVLEPFEIQLRAPEALIKDDDQFFDFCQANSDYRIERTSDGEIIVMSPESGGSGHGNFRLLYLFGTWDETHRLGEFFGSSSGFILPNGAIRGPDVAWVSNKRLEKLTEKDWNHFLPLCPDFVLELRSPSDRLPALQDKMAEYVANGARLGWLVDPIKKQVHVYRPNLPPEVLNEPVEVSADPVLPGFRLPLQKVWSATRRGSR
jgi:Uma2 family endonuclease